MIIIIDAYNLLKQLLKASFARQQQIDRFIDYFFQYAQRKGHTVYLVFDGGSYVRPTILEKKHLLVVYSGQRQTADEYIAYLIEENAHKQTLVVSCDRFICSFAAKNNVATIDSLEFYHITQLQREKVKPVSKKSGHLYKLPKDESNQDLDALMEQASKTLVYKDVQDNQTNDSRYQKSTLSKREKKLINFTKKL